MKNKKTLNEKFLGSVRSSMMSVDFGDRMIDRYKKVAKLANDYTAESDVVVESDYYPNIESHGNVLGVNMVTMAAKSTQSSAILAELNNIAVTCMRHDNWVMGSLVMGYDDNADHPSYNQFIRKVKRLNQLVDQS